MNSLPSTTSSQTDLNKNDATDACGSTQQESRKQRTDESNNYSSKRWITQATLEYICFLFLTICFYIPTNYYQGHAKKLLNNKSHVKIILISQYSVQILMLATISHWTKWFNVKQRMTACIAIFIITIGCILYSFPIMAHQSDGISPNELILHKTIIISCVILTSVAFQCCEATVMQMVSNYNKKCTNGMSTGAGLGALLGSFLTVFQVNVKLVIPFLFIFPITMAIIVYKVLPEKEHADDDGDDDYEDDDESTNDAEMDDDKTNENKKTKSIDNNSDAGRTSTGDLELGKVKTTKDKNESPDETAIANGENNDKDLSLLEQQKNEELSIYERKLNIFQATQLVFFKFSKYSVPYFATYFFYEFTRCALLGEIFLKNNYEIFNTVFRGGSFIGKASTNLWSTKKLFAFPFFIAIVFIFLSFLYFTQNSLSFVNYLTKDNTGVIFMHVFFALPVGIVYGSTSSNIYLAIRTNVKNEIKRKFVLGNILQGSAWGQFIGTLMAFAFEGVANIFHKN